MMRERLTLKDVRNEQRTVAHYGLAPHQRRRKVTRIDSKNCNITIIFIKDLDDYTFVTLNSFITEEVLHKWFLALGQIFFKRL